MHAAAWMLLQRLFCGLFVGGVHRSVWQRGLCFMFGSLQLSALTSVPATVGLWLCNTLCCMVVEDLHHHALACAGCTGGELSAGTRVSQRLPTSRVLLLRLHEYVHVLAVDESCY